MKKLPIGIQTFKDIREDDYIYIDKTKEAYELIENYRYIFLSRPRRFGKSLFLDTLKELFEGNKELFKGLYVYDKWDWTVQYPVIKISFTNVTNTHDIIVDIKENLKTNQENLQVSCDTSLEYGSCFAQLIRRTYEKYNQKVVILIDEYDKPILDLIYTIDEARKAREIVKRLYSVIKDNDAYIKFAFLTGVSKFSKASIFSGLNMLTDISLMPKYGNICGYTQANIENEFMELLEGVDLVKLKNWYNGYNFLKDKAYNPFDILQFIANDKTFDNYWFATGTPTFLIKLIEKNHYFLPKLANLVVDKKLLDSFDIENIDFEVILYQSGYLTIDKVLIDEDLDLIEYKLRLPNQEVKRSLNDFIISRLTQTNNPNIIKSPLIRALKSANLEALEQTLISLFASIPYNNYTKNSIEKYEGFYASIIFAYLQSLGVHIVGEDVTNKGRIDLSVFIEDKIYIIEFKVDGKDPLQQIKEKRYYEKYQNQSKDIYLVGMVFDSRERNIKEFVWEKIR